MRVLLLNPPGQKRYLRDCYCSTISKGAYLWQPADLLSASAILGEKNELSVLDCIARGFSPKKASGMIKEISPELIYMLISSLSLNEDIEFARLLKREIRGVRIICSGEPVLSDEFAEKNDVFDILVRNYTSPDLGNPEELLKMGGGRVIAAGDKRRSSYFSIGQPYHELFDSDRYWIPFARLPFATLITDFGCPFGCRFCNSNFHYAKRDDAEVMEDIRRIAVLGFKHIFIKDMTFLIDRERSLRFAEEIARHKMTFNCYSRIDLVDNDILDQLKRLGLRLIQFGVEDYDESVLESEGKKLSYEKTISVFRHLRETGVFTGAHFIVGLPSRNGQYEYDRLFRLIRDLRPSYISVNIFTPRTGSYYSENTDVKRPADSERHKSAGLLFRSVLSTSYLITDPIKDISRDTFLWYLKAVFGMIKGN